MAASTNTPSVQWNIGNTSGKNVSGGTAAIPGAVHGIVVSTSTAAPTAAPNGAPYHLASTDFYAWNNTTWVGPYSVAT